MCRIRAPLLPFVGRVDRHPCYLRLALLAAVEFAADLIDLTLKPIVDIVDVAIHLVALIEVAIVAVLAVKIQGKRTETDQKAEVCLRLCIRDLWEEEREGDETDGGQTRNALEHAILVEHDSHSPWITLWKSERSIQIISLTIRRLGFEPSLTWL